MDRDLTKLFLFLALSMAVLLLVYPGRRPLAAAPLDPGNMIGESDTAPSMISRGAGFANVATVPEVPPMQMLMPETGSLN